MDDSTSPAPPPKPPQPPVGMNRTQATYFLIYGGRILSDFAPDRERELQVVAKMIEALHTVGCTFDELDMAILAGKNGLESGWESLIDFTPKGTGQ